MSEAKKCPKCGERVTNEALEWRCTRCGYTQCIEPEYCPPKQKEKKE